MRPEFGLEQKYSFGLGHEPIPYEPDTAISYGPYHIAYMVWVKPLKMIETRTDIGHVSSSSPVLANSRLKSSYKCMEL